MMGVTLKRHRRVYPKMASDQPPARWKALGSVHARSQETAVTLILALAGIAAAVLLFLILAHVFVRRMSNH
jgi:hypothetical protein